MSDSTQDPHRIAIVQQPPVFLDRNATIERAISYIHEAADNGARLVAFSETYIPGYPEWIGLVHYRTEGKLITQLHQQLLANTVNLDAGHLDPLCQVARSRGVTVVCGIQECDGAFSRSTLYNTAVTIDPSGAIVNRHRKLMPTGVERGLWGMGDGSGLRVVETPVGRIGMLTCFENQMPLARYALYAQGIDIYLALTVADGDLWLASMRHIAFEGACWVLNCGTALHSDAIPSDFPIRNRLADQSWIRGGDAAVINPSGKVVAGPLHDSYGILYADCTPDLIAASRRRLDVAGHYNRPDIFQLDVDRRHQNQIHYRDDEEQDRGIQ